MDELVKSYQVLGLQSDATPEEARQAYRDLVNVWHPDRFGHDERLRLKAQDKLKEINAAYETIKTSFREAEATQSKSIPSEAEPPADSQTPESRRQAGAGRGRWILAGIIVAALIVTGVVLATKRKQAKPRYALTFNGNARVEMATTGSLSGTFTVECWAMTRRSKGTETIVCSRGPKDCSFDIKFREGKRFHADIGDGSRWLVKMANVRFNYNPDIWYHLAYVVTPSNYNIYVNGALADYRSIYPPGQPLLYNEEHRLCLGADALETADLDGSIAEVRIWWTARTAEEIKANMNKRLTGVEHGLQGCWRFDEGSGTAAADASTHGFTGKFIGNVQWTTNTPLIEP